MRFVIVCSAMGLLGMLAAGCTLDTDSDGDDYGWPAEADAGMATVYPDADNNPPDGGGGWPAVDAGYWPPEDGGGSAPQDGGTWPPQDAGGGWMPVVDAGPIAGDGGGWPAMDAGPAPDDAGSGTDCSTITHEAVCVVTPWCEAVYVGNNCQCDSTGSCDCDSWEFSACQ